MVLRPASKRGLTALAKFTNKRSARPPGGPRSTPNRASTTRHRNDHLSVWTPQYFFSGRSSWIGNAVQYLWPERVFGVPARLREPGIAIQFPRRVRPGVPREAIRRRDSESPEPIFRQWEHGELANRRRYTRAAQPSCRHHPTHPWARSSRQPGLYRPSHARTATCWVASCHNATDKYRNRFI